MTTDWLVFLQSTWTRATTSGAKRITPAWLTENVHCLKYSCWRPPYCECFRILEGVTPNGSACLTHPQKQPFDRTKSQRLYSANERGCHLHFQCRLPWSSHFQGSFRFQSNCVPPLQHFWFNSPIVCFGGTAIVRGRGSWHLWWSAGCKSGCCWIFDSIMIVSINNDCLIIVMSPQAIRECMELSVAAIVMDTWSDCWKIKPWSSIFSMLSPSTRTWLAYSPLPRCSCRAIDHHLHISKWLPRKLERFIDKVKWSAWA